MHTGLKGPAPAETAGAGYGIDEYVPRLLRDREPGSPRFWTTTGTLVFADISGFTKLSERLARTGRAGSEELVTAISGVFTPLIDDILAAGGDVLKFGGDALLFLVTGEAHAARAISAAVAMRATLRRVGVVQTATGAVRLRMSVGAHSGDFQCLLVGRDHEELVIVGPDASTTVAMEGTAEAGEILVSPATAALLPASCIGRPKGDGLLIRRSPKVLTADHVRVDAAPAEDCFVPLALRGRLESIVAESEHRQVTVAFLHFGGVDTLLDTVGIEETHRRADELASTVVEICGQIGVTIICTDIADDGAKFMLACGAPDAYPDSEARMLRACRGILDRDHGLPVRIGVNRGPVYAGAVGSAARFTYSTMGDAVNLAARVMGKASPGQLLATAAVVNRCGRRFDLSPLEPFMVKGKSQPVHAYSVGRVRHQQSALRPGGAAFVGRSAERDELTQRLTAAERGHGGSAAVIGDTGMGKSQLVARATESWTHRQITVDCEQYESATPYFALRQLLRAAASIDDGAPADMAGDRLRVLVDSKCPQLAPWLPLLALATDAATPSTTEVDELKAEYRRSKLAEVATELLDAVVPGPLLVIVEDATWMDDPSAEVFRALLRTARQRQWLIAMTSRPETSTGLDARAADTVIELEPLTRDDIAEIYRSVAGRWPPPHVLDELVARADGNALFAVELSAAVERDGLRALPPSIEDLVGAHLDRLDVDDRRCLRYAAVAGSRISLPLLQRALGDLLPSLHDPHQMARLSEFLEPVGGDEYVFRHDVFRRVAYEALPYARRRELHGRIAEAMLQDGERDDALPLLSLHFVAAQRPNEAWSYSVRAGDRAMLLFAPVEAARFYKRALEVAPRLELDPDQVRQIAQSMGDAYRLAAQYDEAAAAYAAARKRAADPFAAAEVMLREGILRERMGRYRAAVRWYLRGLRTLPEASDCERSHSLTAQLDVELAAARYRQGRLEDSIRWCLAALPAAAVAGDRDAEGHAYYLLDAAYTDLGSEAAQQYRERALPIFRELGDLVREADVLNNLGIDAYYEGRLDEALAYYERCRALRIRAGDVVGAAVAANNIGEVYSDEGRFAEAGQLFHHAMQVFEAVDYPIGYALAAGNLGVLAARDGRPAEARNLLVDARNRFEALGAAPYVAQMDMHLAQLGETSIDLADEVAVTT